MVEIESIRVLGIDSDDLTHDLLTVKQGAAYYGCSIENVHKMIQAGKLDCFIDEDNTKTQRVQNCLRNQKRGKSDCQRLDSKPISLV